jgi:hypothetical protein
MVYKFIWILLFYNVIIFIFLAHLHLTKNTINDVHDWGVSKIKN